MSRTRRMSRWLIAMTAVVLALGLIFWISKLNRGTQSAAAAPTTKPVSPIALVTAATQPAAVASATTQPAATTPPAPAPQTLVLTTPGFGASSTTRPALLAAVTEAPVAPKPSDTKSQPVLQPAAGTPVSKEPLADAKAQLEAKQFLTARRILNSAISSGSLSAADLASAKQLLATVNATVVFSTQLFPTDEYGGTYTVKSGDRLAKIAATNEVTADLLLHINSMSDARKLRAGQNIKILKGPVNAVVSKKNFTVELWLGNPGEKSAIYLTSFPVGLGKDDSTPLGTWMVEPQKKLTNPTYYSPRGEGKIEADDPKNPLGEYWIGLSGIEGGAVGKKSYGIHGTIDPNSIGKQESMGCIRLKNEDIRWVYELLVEGKSTVVVTE